MANTTWIVKLENNSGQDLKWIDGEDTKRNGVLKKGQHVDFEGSGFCFPWLDLAKNEQWKAIKFYDTAGKFLFQIYQSWNRDRLEWTKIEAAKDKDAIVLSPDSSMGDRKAVYIEKGMIPSVLNQYPNYNRFQSYYNNWMNMTHKEYYKTAPGDTGIAGIAVSDYLTDIFNQLKYPKGSNFLEKSGPFDGYLVESWHIDIARRVLDKQDGGIEYYGGLTWPWLTRLIGGGSKNPDGTERYYGGYVSHEFGHQYENSFKTHTKVGGLLKGHYDRLRSTDFTSSVPHAERFAEDFVYFFGTTKVRNVYDPNTYKTGSTIRKPDKIVGLKELMRGSWPVFNYLNARNFTNFNYDEKNKWFQWYANNRWEAMAAVDGIFYWHNGKAWVKF